MATPKMDYHHNSILWRRSLSRGRKYEPVFPGVSENICIRRFELLQVVNYCDESNRSPWEDRRPEARAARISFAQTGLCVCSDTLVGSVSLIFLLSFSSLFPFLFFLLLPSFLLLSPYLFPSLPLSTYPSPPSPLPPSPFPLSLPFTSLLLSRPRPIPRRRLHEPGLPRDNNTRTDGGRSTGLNARSIYRRRGGHAPLHAPYLAPLSLPLPPPHSLFLYPSHPRGKTLLDTLLV